MNEILETYTMTPEEEIKWLRQCVRELQESKNKAIEYIGQEILVYDNESDEYKVGNKLLGILKGENK